jgi:hypothetical protein
MPSIPELTRSSSFIFSGTVVEHGRSTVPAVPPNDKLVVVRLDRALRVDPVLGDLQGKMITVAASAPASLSTGQKAVFFTNSWIHGRGIAVREVEHRDIGQEEEVAAAVAQLPQVHLLERLQSAGLVVEAEVVGVRPVERTTFERNAAQWAEAELKVTRVLRGEPTQSASVYFPTSDHPLWAKAPRFQERQRGIFVLRGPSRKASPSEAKLPGDALIAPDPADYQPESRLQEVETLLAALR